MKRLRADSRGFAFSLDVLLALIPLTIILGMAVANMDNIMYLSENTIYQSSLQRVGSDAADTLVETSGVPYNWENMGNSSTVGLAKYDINKNLTVKNLMSPAKLSAVDINDLEALVGSGYGVYLKVSSANSNNSTIIRTVGTYNSSSQNIVRVERLVSASNLDLVADLEGLIRDAGQPRTYTTIFPTNDAYVQAYDYWVLVINRGYNSATVDVNNNQVLDPNEINQHITEIKQKIDVPFMYNQTYLQDNVVNVRTVSTPDSTMDVYVIAAPKGTPEKDINLDNIKLRPAKLELFIWTR